MLKGKTVVLGVTGSIAAYKIANLASALVKLHADVNVIMTKNATNFINPITFETLTGNKCLVDTFDRNFEFNVEHVALAKRADIFMVAPASANVIGKIAGGIYRIGKSASDTVIYNKSVNYNLNAVLNILIELDFFGKVINASVNSYSYISRLSGRIKHLGVFALFASDKRC